MNLWLLAAGVAAAGVAGVHLVAGHVEPVRPLLASALDEVPKRTLHVVWHMVSADLAIAAVTLLFLAAAHPPGATLVARLVALHFLAYAAIFVVVALSVDWPRPLLRLPQWALLLPVAALTWLGT